MLMDRSNKLSPQKIVRINYPSRPSSGSRERNDFQVRRIISP
jgi:hypothetical protein